MTKPNDSTATPGAPANNSGGCWLYPLLFAVYPVKVLDGKIIWAIGKAESRTAGME